MESLPSTNEEEQTTAMLRSAEAIFQEFYQPSTSNARKQEIERQIKSVLGNPKQWKFWTDCIALTDNQFLMMHCLNLLNDFVSNFWVSWASAEQKNYVKNQLMLYLTQRTSVLPSFVITKLLKLLVDIGRNDWPHFHPHFFSNIENLFKDPTMCGLGLRMLKLVSEEFMSPKEDIRQSRREELKKLLIQKGPVIFNLLQGVLLPFVEALKTSAAAQVPKNLIQNCSEAFQVFSHMLTWIPPGSLIPSGLLSCIFYFANCDPNNVHLYELATSSLSCIGDIASKSCSSTEMEKSLWTIYEFAYLRLEAVNQELQDYSELSDSSSEYFQQFIELLRPLLVNHLQRFESHQGFPTMNFLERFFRFTFNIPAFDLFLNCVDIWNDFLDRILAVSSCRASATKAAILQSYSAPILALVDHLLMRIQFQHNQAQLKELSEESNQAETLSERDDYFQRCIGVLIKAGEILPKEVLEKFVYKYSELQQVFARIEGLLKTVSSGNQVVLILAVEKKEEIKQLHCVIRDLGIVARATSSHCGLLTGDLFSTYADQVLAVVQVILQGIQFLNGPMNCLCNFEAHPPLSSDFIYLHTSLYMSLESLFPWLTQFYNTHSHGSTDGMNKLVAAVIKTCLDPILLQSSASVSSASSKTLKSLTKIIRVPNMLELEPVAELYRKLTEAQQSSGLIFWNLPLNVKINLLSALSNILTLPFSHQNQSVDQQSLDDRANKHAVLLTAVTSQYSDVQQLINPNPQVVELVRSTLALLNGLLNNTAEDPKKSKQIVLASMTPLLQTTVQLLPSFKRSAEERSAVLRFVLNVFSSLRSAFPPELRSPLSDLFEGLFEQFLDAEELLRSFWSVDPLQVESLSTCFDLLKLVVSDPAYKSYLPFVISLCHIVCPALQNVNDIRIDFRASSYELLLSVLTCHWTYFFKSVRLVAATNGDGIDVSVKDEKTEAHDFLVIMRCLGSALVQPEISLTQLVLKGLNQLHGTKQIFEKAPFQQFLRRDFLNALLGMLVNKEKQLLADEIHTALFSVAGVDGGYFYGTYLPDFLGTWPNLDDDQRRKLYAEFVMETDQVAFTEQIQTLVAEMRCYTMYNSMRS